MPDSKNSLTTYGFVIKIYGDAVAWRTHKQTSVALSTCQAGYVAMSEACQDLMSLHNTVKFIFGRDMYPMTVFCDNLAAQACTKSNGGNKLRYMVERRNHYIKECINNNYIQINWVESKEQLADTFTKALEKNLHKKLTCNILNARDM